MARSFFKNISSFLIGAHSFGRPRGYTYREIIGWAKSNAGGIQVPKRSIRSFELEIEVQFEVFESSVAKGTNGSSVASVIDDLDATATATWATTTAGESGQNATGEGPYDQNAKIYYIGSALDVLTMAG